MTSFAELICVVPPHAIETVSGRYVDVVEPDPETIVMEDIAWALSRQARFAGHTLSEEVWNVAQHSVFVKDLIDMGLDPENNCGLHGSLNVWIRDKGYMADQFLSLANTMAGGIASVLMGGLMHDASEAFLIDLPSPVKRHQALREPYKEMEKKMEAAIHNGLLLPDMTPLEKEIIVWADLLALQIEAAVLMPSRGRGWSGTLPIMNLVDINLFPMQVKPWRLAYDDFVLEYNRLWQDI